MPKNAKAHSKTRGKQSKQKTVLRTWTAPAPYQETQYPFESSIDVDCYSDVLQMDLGPGIRLYPSTICICRQDTSDSLLLTKIGEQFREFYPTNDMPWIGTTEAKLGQLLWQDESEDVKDSLNYFAERGFIELTTSTPSVYRYRLNVDAVRSAKNRCYRPLNEVESIEHSYIQRFPTLETQIVAFGLICNSNYHIGRLLLNIWHYALGETRDSGPKSKVAWVDVNDVPYVNDGSLFATMEQQQQAIHVLEEKHFLEIRAGRTARYEYRPHASAIWNALQRLPQTLPDVQVLEGYKDDEDDSSPIEE